MNFAEAKDHRISFGKYIGKTLDCIAEADDGLLYLDHMRGVMPGWPSRNERDLEAIVVYLDDPSISKQLGDLL